MNYSQQPRKSSRMVATKNDPWLSVSLLAEYTYCPRAGIIQNEISQEDTGEEIFTLGRGGKRLFYDWQQLLRKQKKIQKGVLWSLFTFLFSLIASLISGMTQNVRLFSDVNGNLSLTFFAYASMATFWTGIVLFAILIYWFCFYLQHYLPAKSSQPYQPDPNHTEQLYLNWWSLINAGFQPIRPQDQYRDTQWHIAGRPWLVLVKGDLRIPVFKKRPNRGTAGEKLFRQHYVRMAAYCHILEKSEHVRSPYGIILLGGTHTAIIVPNQPGTKKTFHDNLLNARATIAQSGYQQPFAPHNRQLCVLCPHSKRDYDTNRSTCGDRFHWTPPNYKDD